MFGIMNCRVKLEGTGLVLDEGERVVLTLATNLPDNGTIRYFARPADGVWSDCVERSPEYSVLIDADDVDLQTVRITTFDDSGAVVETQTLSVEDAVTMVGNFILSQAGIGGMSGRIEFDGSGEYAGSKPGKWHIADWAGNKPFPGRTFATFEDGDAFLSEHIRRTNGELSEKEFSDIRGEFDVEEIDG